MTKTEVKQKGIIRKRDIVRKRNGENKETKQYERIQTGENKNEDNIDIYLFFR